MSIVKERGVVEDYATKTASVGYGTDQTNYISYEKWSSFEDLEIVNTLSNDFYVESGTATSISTGALAVDGIKGLKLVCGTGAGSVITTGYSATAGGSANQVPMLSPSPGVGAGKYYIFSCWHNKTGATACTVAISLSNDAGETQVVMSARALSTTATKFVSDPFTITIDISAGFAYRITMNTGTGTKTANFDCLALNYVGTTSSVIEPPPYTPGCIRSSDGLAYTSVIFDETTGKLTSYASTVIADVAYVDAYGRPDTLRLTGGDVAAANIIHDDGSGLSKDGATVGLTLAASKAIIVGTQTVYTTGGDFAIASGKKITVGTQDVIDADGDLSIASGKKITVGTQDIIDASGNMALASGKTLTIGTKSYVDSTGRLVASKSRQIYSMDNTRVSNDNTEITALECTFTPGTPDFYNKIHVPFYKWAHEKYIRVRAMIKASHDGSAQMQAVLSEGGAGGYDDSAVVDSETYTQVECIVDISSGSDNGDNDCVLLIAFTCDVGEAVSFKHVVAEVISDTDDA
jgi:hypothetical protein